MDKELYRGPLIVFLHTYHVEKVHSLVYTLQMMRYRAVSNAMPVAMFIHPACTMVAST